MKVLECLITACCFFICAAAITYAEIPVAKIVGGPALSGDECLEIHFQGNGIDPDGKPLDAAMPRWSMSGADLADLVGYLSQSRTHTHD